VTVTVKGIRLESFVSDLLFIGFDNEIQREGVLVKWKETVRCDTCGWDGDV
jgi:predicted sulfurtransferase